MKIRKTDIPNLDTKSKIEAAVQIHRTEEKARFEEGVNKIYTQHIKIRELSLHMGNGGELEFIDKTLDEEKEAVIIEKMEKAEQEKQDRIMIAKTDGAVRDLLITELMNEAGFTPYKVILSRVQEVKDKKDMSQFWEDRSIKLKEIKKIIFGH